MAEFDWVAGLAGGVLIGLAATLLLAGSGRIAGISGIFGEILSRPMNAGAWRWLFIVGLLAGALLQQLISGNPVVPREGYPVILLLFGGLLVGIGTRMGGGCTSGHGVCGMARLSPRSLVATVTFLAVAIATVTLTRHGLGFGGLAS